MSVLLRLAPCRLSVQPLAMITRSSRKPTNMAMLSLPSRTYATHKPTNASSLLSQALDQKQNRNAQQEMQDSIGPLPLGMVGPSRRGNEKVKKWAELSTGGKAARAAAGTSNLAIILVGAGLSVMLVYALTSELFSNNSPTVLYGQACEKIKASPRVARYLHGPLHFHNNPPSVVRPRHRNPHVAAQIAVDSSGREHMYLTFFVQGSSPSAASSQEPALADMSWDDVVNKTYDLADSARRSAHSAIRYLVGKPMPPTPGSDADGTQRSPANEEPKGVWSLAGLFSGLKGVTSGSGGSSAPTNEITEGEVHAELIRNDDGYFVFRYLLVDLPNSRVRHPVRVFIERAPGVSEHEPVMHWGS